MYKILHLPTRKFVAGPSHRETYTALLFNEKARAEIYISDYKLYYELGNYIRFIGLSGPKPKPNFFRDLIRNQFEIICDV